MSHDCPEDVLDIPGSSHLTSEYINKFKRQFVSCKDDDKITVPLENFILCDHPELHSVLFTKIVLHSVTALPKHKSEINNKTEHKGENNRMAGVLTIKTKHKDNEINWTKHRLTNFEREITFGYPFVRQSTNVPEEIYTIRKEYITDQQIARMIGIQQSTIPNAIVEEYRAEKKQSSSLVVRNDIEVMVEQERIRKDNEFIHALNDIVPVSAKIHIHTTVPNTLFLISFSFLVL